MWPSRSVQSAFWPCGLPFLLFPRTCPLNTANFLNVRLRGPTCGNAHPCMLTPVCSPLYLMTFEICETGCCLFCGLELSLLRLSEVSGDTQYPKEGPEQS